MKRTFVRLVLEEEIERIDDRHLRHKVDGHAQLAGPFQENQPCEEVAVRVLLPIEEVLFRRDLQRIAENRRAAMRGRAEADDVRPEADRLVVSVSSAVVERDADGHWLS